MGDNWRSFSYYKAIPVIEKSPLKTKNAEQVKNLPSIGKSLQDHVSIGSSKWGFLLIFFNMITWKLELLLIFFIWQIQESVTTGKLSKLEHFETDEKLLNLRTSFELKALFVSLVAKACEYYDCRSLVFIFLFYNLIFPECLYVRC